jgi:hypothetical protein
MTDEHLRSTEREAFADPEAEDKLRRERCREGQCCAHFDSHVLTKVKTLEFKTSPMISEDFMSATLGLNIVLQGTLEDVVEVARFLLKTLEVNEPAPSPPKTYSGHEPDSLYSGPEPVLPCSVSVPDDLPF